MACGLAPVTTTVGSIGKEVSDGITGSMAPDPLVANDSLRAKRGTAARGRAIDFGLERW